MNRKILIVGHGTFSSSLLESAKLMTGALNGVWSLELDATETPESFKDRVAALVSEHQIQIVLSDMVGGTPDNIAKLVSKDHKDLTVIGGANLPLLLVLAMQPELAKTFTPGSPLSDFAPRVTAVKPR
ncbi:MAG: hypothetical protein KF916_02510 [Microbacteriaceae bacterium]|nr:hypothetical protein [Microbacteriaceae bacterium]